ncbi:hypothetical protein BDB00DRAFT_802129 [Zychaea mexicana]|uniref:uncharacterized protein n=1 Tax=Zychaea mexicana TaxID=64656 RepID=UPI0022FDDE73|nr:uncharacterized protein BDB00DRAFT_802129 [Zychaea mexicana]KAI9497845.1 hypothetical protein BDB00DRAFT_802129 [Zychaea mexicana]
MSKVRVSVEGEFGRVTNLWSGLDQKRLQRSMQLSFFDYSSPCISFVPTFKYTLKYSDLLRSKQSKMIHYFQVRVKFTATKRTYYIDAAVVAEKERAQRQGC